VGIDVTPKGNQHSVEEQGKNTEFDVFDKHNESKILEMYQNFVEVQLESQRKDEIKRNADAILSRLSPNKCPICTLTVPCKHYTEESLKAKYDTQQQEITAKIAKQKSLSKKQNSKESIKSKMNKTSNNISYKKVRMLSPESTKPDSEMIAKPRKSLTSVTHSNL
jgi:hypothetical protein